jgi:uncharacterized membrane protein (UPF0127 family)
VLFSALLFAMALAISCSSLQEPVATTFTPSPTIAAKSPGVSATPTQVPVPTATSTTTLSTAPEYPEPTFVDNADCENIERSTLPLADLTVTSGSVVVSAVVEVASLPAERQQGLMCRSVIAPGTGMLFTWESEHNGGFWMFNTYAPLDIIYLGGTGEPVLRQMSPCPRSTGEDDNAWRARCIVESSQYGSGGSYRNALELPQGWLSTQGIDSSATERFVVSFVLRD